MFERAVFYCDAASNPKNHPLPPPPPPPPPPSPILLLLLHPPPPPCVFADALQCRCRCLHGCRSMCSLIKSRRCARPPAHAALPVWMAHDKCGQSRSMSPPHNLSSEAPVSKNWDSGFFDVCAVGCCQMCQAHWCACITFAQNEHSLRLLEKPDVQPSLWGYASRVPSYACLLSCGAHCFVHDAYRRRIRMLYRVPPVGPCGETGDFCLSWCPTCCPRHHQR